MPDTQGTTADPKDDKEKRRRKQYKRMGKILGNAWQLDTDDHFHEDAKSTTDNVLCLSKVGEKIDQKAYKLGRHGWEDFARDLGGVYQRHIRRYVDMSTLTF